MNAREKLIELYSSPSMTAIEKRRYFHMIVGNANNGYDVRVYDTQTGVLVDEFHLDSNEETTP